LTCGTCCFSELETFVRVSGSDYARLGQHADTLVRFDGVRAYMRMTDGHCSALRVEPEFGRFVCGVYASRPDVCRDLEQGSGACRGERELKAERPLLALQRARA
jgi:hypothetical protein